MPEADKADLERDFELMQAAVREAGLLAMRFYKGDYRSWIKPGDTPVTEADIAVNDLLHKRLAVARADYGWLSEETEDDPSRLTKQMVWVVDPIDGTRAFARGKPHFAISVALVRAGQPVLGVLFNPALDEFFVARHGAGAQLNGQPIRVSKRHELSGCRMAANAGMFRHPAWPEKWPEMHIIDRNSVAYRIALVACGGADAALALSSKNDWDLAAADLILREAGGLMTRHDGQRFIYNLPEPRHPSLIAAGPALHAAISKRVSRMVLPE
ncbi:MAG: 3'(2'),5'-bisphosphate nucleotidase CysQ [Parvibaculum sp.]